MDAAIDDLALKENMA